MGYSWGEVCLFEIKSSGIRSSGKCSTTGRVQGIESRSTSGNKSGKSKDCGIFLLESFHTVPNKIKRSRVIHREKSMPGSEGPN
jgi:hypothetical protein